MRGSGREPTNVMFTGSALELTTVGVDVFWNGDSVLVNEV